MGYPNTNIRSDEIIHHCELPKKICFKPIYSKMQKHDHPNVANNVRKQFEEFCFDRSFALNIFTQLYLILLRIFNSNCKSNDNMKNDPYLNMSLVVTVKRTQKLEVCNLSNTNHHLKQSIKIITTMKGDKLMSSQNLLLVQIIWLKLICRTLLACVQTQSIGVTTQGYHLQIEKVEKTSLVIVIGRVDL